MHDLKNLVLAFFSALGCNALTADGDYSKSTPAECSVEVHESSKAA